MKSKDLPNEWWRVRKVVGRRPPDSTPLRRSEDLSAFIFQNAKNVLPKRELFPGSEICWSNSLAPGLITPTVGGVAVSLNGFVRAIEDVDILVERALARKSS